MDVSITSQTRSGDNAATRRNTRSTSNQEKERAQDIADSKSNSSGTINAKDREGTAMEATKKKPSDRVERGPNGDVLSYTMQDDVTYRPLDSVYLETERPDAPYSMCTIQEIKSKRDSAIVYVKWYYRPTEVPDLVYQMLIKNRYNQVEDSTVKNLIMSPDVINRELFIDERTESTDTFPITSIKGKCNVIRYNDISEIKDFGLKPDQFFYICSYSPETRRLASLKGETRVGPSHQWSARMRGMFQKAEIPDLLSPSARGYKKDRDYEEMTWQPNVCKSDLITCLQAARSLAAFAGVCDGVLPEEGCITAVRDDTTINALRVIFENNGNPRKAIDELVKHPVPITIESKWTEEQVKRFQRGLRHHGKNFFRIRKELLPMKDTGELVEFYYLWKKTQDHLMIRPHHRKHRRQAAMKKNEGKLKTCNYASGDHTSTEEETESEESEKEVNAKCKHCQKSVVTDLKTGGKDSVKLCMDCRLFYKKYGENRTIITVEEVESSNEADMDSSPAPISHVPPFLFKPIKEEKLNNLLPKKPAKSLTKAKPTPDIKKSAKREWPEGIKTEQDDSSTLKRPKSEPENDDAFQHSDTEHRKGYLLDESSYTEARGESPDAKRFPLSENQTIPRIIPNQMDTMANVPVSRSVGVSSIIRTDEIPAHTAVKPSETYSSNLGPFVPTAQMSQRLNVKPSALEAISKLAMSPGTIPRCSTFGYTVTPPNLVSQSIATSQGPALYSHSSATTVTTTSGVRPSVSVEPSSSNFVRHPHTGDHSEHSMKDKPAGPNPPSKHIASDKREKLSYIPKEMKNESNPVPGYHRGFPFDPRVTDQIICNANMSRSQIKEEARPVSPGHREDGHPGSSARHRSAINHNMKQEPYHPSSHAGRSLPPESSMPHQPPFPKNHQHHPTNLPTNSSSHASNHRASPEHFYPSHTSTHSRPQELDDSDVEFIREPRQPTPDAVQVEIPCSYGYSARFIKYLDRGSNSCFRTDYVFTDDDASRRRRQERQREEMKKQQQQQQQNRESHHSGESSKVPPPKPSSTPSASTSSSKPDRIREDKIEPRERARREGPPIPPSAPSHAAAYRSTPGHGSAPRVTPNTTPTTAFDQHHRPTPAAFVSPSMAAAAYGPDTPALRQLQQFASIDMRRNAMAETGLPLGPALLQYYQLASLDPEMAEREFRERERLAKMGDIKPQDMINPAAMQALPPNVLAGLQMGGLPGQHIPSMEQLHQYQAQILNSLPSGAHPHGLAAVAANLPPGAIAAAPFSALPPDAYAERMSLERFHAERLAAEQQYQLDLLHSHHSHSHVHSHLHLHGSSQTGGPPPTAAPHPITAIPQSSHPFAEQLLNPYAVQAMGPLATGASPLLTQSMLRNQQAAAAQAVMMQHSLAAPHLHTAAAIAAREQAAAASQSHPFTQHLQAVNEQHVIESQRARAVAALQDQQQQYLAHAARFK